MLCYKVFEIFLVFSISFRNIIFLHMLDLFGQEKVLNAVTFLSLPRLESLKDARGICFMSMKIAHLQITQIKILCH